MLKSFGINGSFCITDLKRHHRENGQLTCKSFCTGHADLRTGVSISSCMTQSGDTASNGIDYTENECTFFFCTFQSH